MAFIVTARKWRPQLFDDVVGQQHISKTLKNAIENNRIGHAYIFAGPRGVGKTTTARILAKRLNCENPNGGEPCNECGSCQNFLKSQSLDIIEIDGASNRRIDEIRTLRESVKYAPTSGLYKVYIIDEVHMLTTESFNALLKTLEEPPEHTIFIFATTDIHKVPLTIISRCQRFDFRRIELSEIKKLLKKIADAEKIEIDDESLTIIAKKADGALRDAESIFDQVVSFCGNIVDISILKKMLNLIDEDIYFQLSDAILQKEFKAGFQISDLIYSNGWNFIDFINGVLEHFRNISSVVITKSVEFIETSEALKKRYLDYTDKFSEGDLLRILSFLSKTQNEIKIVQNQKLKVEIALTQLIGFEKSSTISDLLTKVSDLDIISEKKKVEPNLDLTPSQTKDKSFIPPPTIKKPQQVKAKPKIRKENLESYKLKVEPSETELTFENINSKWDLFKEQITKERFTLGPLLNHALPISLKQSTLILDIAEKEDVQILNSSKEFLCKRFFEVFKLRLQMKFSYNSKTNILNGKEKIEFADDENDQYKDHPLVKSIITDLGGREIK